MTMLRVCSAASIIFGFIGLNSANGLVDTDNHLLGALHERGFTVIPDIGSVLARKPGLPSLEFRDLDRSYYAASSKLNTILYSGTHIMGLRAFASASTGKHGLDLEADVQGKWILVSWKMPIGEGMEHYLAQLDSWQTLITNLNTEIYSAMKSRGPDPSGPTPGQTRSVEMGGGTTLDIVWVPGGTFTMGSPESEPGRRANEGPSHRVTISSGFWMGKTEVTQRQYRQAMGINPAEFKSSGLDAPVENVSWVAAKNFCDRMQGFLVGELAGKTVRLPTETEWEYACRADVKDAFHFGPCLDSTQANYDGSSPQEGCTKGTFRGGTTAAKSFSANAWGLFDMHGNVWEWCLDGLRPYDNSPKTDPTGPTVPPSAKVIRGGSWMFGAQSCRSASRYAVHPDQSDNNIGFRILVMP